MTTVRRVVVRTVRTTAAPSPSPSPRDPGYPRYVISVAAELTGTHPQTLRAYERRGLIYPARTPGGGRRYSDADLARVARIQALTRIGFPLAGIALVLDLVEAGAAAGAHDLLDAFLDPTARTTACPPTPRRTK